MRSIVLICSLLVICVSKAQYIDPVSVEYDPVGDRYFVSCFTVQTILQIDQAGGVTDFASNIGYSPKGIELKGDTLFACTGGRLKGYLTASGSEVFDLDLGAQGLAGLTTDGHFLYASDFLTRAIYKVEPTSGVFSILVDSTLYDAPIYMAYDPSQDRLLVGLAGNGGHVASYDAISGTQLNLYTLNVEGVRGITFDCDGQILVASLFPDRITRYNAAFTVSEPVIDTGLNNPLDFDYDHVHGRVCVPNGGDFTVVVPELTGCTIGVQESVDEGLFVCYPDPTDGPLRPAVVIQRPEPFTVRSLSGALVLAGTLHPEDDNLDLSALEAGVYVVDLIRMDRRTRVVKK